MSRLSRPRSRHALDLLLNGPAEPLSAEDLSECRAQYGVHREALLAELPAGRRPWAWWTFDAPGPRAPGESELEALVRLGCATSFERRQLSFQQDRDRDRDRAAWWARD